MASAETLRLSTLKQPGSDGAIAAQHFADLVSEKTDGELTVKVYPGSQLGDWTEVYEQVIEGAVDIAMQPLATSSDKRLAITWFPYAYSDYDTARVAGVFQGSCRLIIYHAARFSFCSMGPPPPALWESASPAPWALRSTSGRSGLSHTEPTGCQFRVPRDQRSGCRSLAA
ncbi:hypothetical protein [Celeribacter halophilus]|uniref:hypothetical protein n=1 Tax=Celeribacter halophilus TaxID=576117 RepID=UPI003A8ED32A